MDKTSQKVIKDPRMVEQGKKLYEMLMKRIKEAILEDNQLPTPSTSSPTCDPTPSTSSPTCDATPSHAIRSNTYVYGVGLLAVLVNGVCVFVACNTPESKNKKQANKKKYQPPKQRHML